MNREDKLLPAAIGLLLAVALALQASAARAAWPKAELSYADPILFPEQRLNNWFEFQMTPVMDGKQHGDMYGMQVHLHTGQNSVYTLGLGRRTQELWASYSAGGTFYKTYSAEMRTTWNEQGGGRSSLVLGMGLDWSRTAYIDNLPGEGDGDDMLEWEFDFGFAVETRPVSGLGVEFYIGFLMLVEDVTDGDSLEKMVMVPQVAMKLSYQVISGGHAVAEVRLPFVLFIDDIDVDDLINIDIAFGWRQNWGPLIGGLSFLFHAYGDGPGVYLPFKDEISGFPESVAMMLDLGFVFY